MQTLREKRERLGLNQADMARLMGVHFVTYTNWEHGNRSPNASTVRLIEMLENVYDNDRRLFDRLAKQYVGRG